MLEIKNLTIQPKNGAPIGRLPPPAGHLPSPPPLHFVSVAGVRPALYFWP